MTLTEQWKNGELKEGWYYIELNEPFDKIHKDISYYSLGSFDIEVDSNYIIEVLAPVPSYEEYKKLKELLKECRETIETSVWGNCSALTDQIDEVIGARLMSYLEELLPEFRKGEVRGDEVTFYEDKKDEV